MFPLKALPLAVAAAVFISGAQLFAQQPNTEYRISKIEPSFVDSPTYSGPRYDKRVTKPQAWLEVQVDFDWQPRNKEPKYTEELTFNYYILLKNKSALFPQGTLLSGSVTHVNIPQGRDFHSVVYVSPRALERFFDGKAPSSINEALVDVGVTISKQGQVVAEASDKSKTGAWWPSFQQTPGFVLNKSETPFAPLAWDYYEAIKPKASGQ